MVIVRHLEASDAEGLVALFRECYGDTYANENFYDASRLQSLIQTSVLRSVVALDEDRVVGHTGLTIRHQGAIAAEAGNTVVSPTMRGQGILGQLGQALRERTLEEGFVGYVHYPTTAHDIMQKGATSGSGRETGIMLAYIPSETEYNDFDESQGRLAATIVYQPLADSPSRSAYLPGRYIEPLHSLAPRLGVERLFKEPAMPTGESSDIDITHIQRRGLTNVSINTIGTDLIAELDRLLSETNAVVHADITMDDPGLDYAVEALAARGFFDSSTAAGCQTSRRAMY